MPQMSPIMWSWTLMLISMISLFFLIIVNSFMLFNYKMNLKFIPKKKWTMNW